MEPHPARRRTSRPSRGPAATSAPELAVVGRALRVGDNELAVGSIVGSNTANVLLVLDLAAGPRRDERRDRHRRPARPGAARPADHGRRPPPRASCSTPPTMAPGTSSPSPWSGSSCP
ncbi:MAG: sodium/calcium exchanger protein [Actinomycetota bacterium]|nr:sodium/calcium exchanger protein [Actinomycetota bacterium]